MPNMYFKVQKEKKKRKRKRGWSGYLLSVGKELQRAALEGGFAGWIGVG